MLRRVPKNIFFIKSAAMFLWIIALILLTGASLSFEIRSFQGGDTAIKAGAIEQEKSGRPDASGWRAVPAGEERTRITAQRKELKADIKTVSDGLIAVFGGPATALSGLAEIEFVQDEGNKWGERCVVAGLVAPSFILPRPNWMPKIVPGAGSLDQLYGKPLNKENNTRKTMLASILAQLPPLPSFPPSSPPSGGQLAPPSSFPPPPPPPPAGKPWFKRLIQELGKAFQDVNSWEDLLDKLADISVNIAVQIPSSDPLLFPVIKNGRLCVHQVHPIQNPLFRSFKNGAAVAGYAGVLPNNNRAALVLLRMCGRDIPPGIKPLSLFWDKKTGKPQAGLATAYSLGVSYFWGGRRFGSWKDKFAPPQLIKAPVEIQPDGTMRPIIDREDLPDYNRMMELWRRHEVAGVNQPRFGTLSASEKTELFSLGRRLGQKYNVLPGSPVFQNGRKVGMYDGKGQIIPVSDIAEGLARLLTAPLNKKGKLATP